VKFDYFCVLKIKWREILEPCESGEIEGWNKEEVKFDYFGGRGKVKLSDIILSKKIAKMKLSFFLVSIQFITFGKKKG